MKKIIIASALVAITTIASAVEVGVSSVRDSGLDKNGVRVTASVGPVAGFMPQLSLTRVDGAYNRYAAGGEYAVTKVGPVAVAATGTLVYQDTNTGADGYGATLGLKATLPLTKTISVVAVVERFAGQERVSASNATSSSLGLTVKF